LAHRDIMEGDTVCAVQTDAFLRELPGLFDDYPRSPEPRDRRFREVLDAVDGLSEENNMALLNLAATHLGDGEAYLEAGSHKGRSLIAATLGNEARAHGIDAFRWESSSRKELEANLRRFGVASRVAIHEGDTEAVLRVGILEDVSVGVFFYDAGHTTDETLGSLRLVRDYLAPEALIVVDDADWERVRRAVDLFVAEDPRVRLAERIVGRGEDQPQWWDGMDLLVWNA
jgi:predicted O-methyltransferase YrrM